MTEPISVCEMCRQAEGECEFCNDQKKEQQAWESKTANMTLEEIDHLCEGQQSENEHE